MFFVKFHKNSAFLMLTKIFYLTSVEDLIMVRIISGIAKRENVVIVKKVTPSETHLRWSLSFVFLQ